MRLSRPAGLIVAAVLLSLCLCMRKDRAVLTIDFTGSSTWRYLLGVDIKGSVKTGDSVKSFESSARTYLTGDQSSHDRGAIYFKTKDTRITSNILSEPQRRNLELQFEGLSLMFSPNEGAIYTPDTESIPVVSIGGWDLYRNFAKVIPVLPGIPVTVGTTWDRERQFPIETTQGSAIGHLYQSFTLDSIFYVDSITRAGALSWLFTYKIEFTSRDSGAVIQDLPLEGNGRGEAVVDLSKRRLTKAHAFFEVPQGGSKEMAIKWSESIHMELIE